VVEDVARRAPLDRSRVYATGLSTGSMMAYRLAAEALDLVAAIAPVAGSMVLVLRTVQLRRERGALETDRLRPCLARTRFLSAADARQADAPHRCE